MTREFRVEGETAMEACGTALGKACTDGAWIYLRGDLGAGKTTLVRGLLHGLGHQGAVKSPTYTLVEPYQLDGRSIHHLDLYRLADPEELEWIGIREIFRPDSLCLVEWPERGAGMLPAADLELDLRHDGSGRLVRAVAGSPRGERLLAAWSVAEPQVRTNPQ